MSLRPKVLTLAASLAAVLAPAAAPAQETPLEKLRGAPEQLADSGFGLRRGSFVLAPIPLSNPTIGSGLILGAGYMFKADAKSDTSFFGAAAMRTDNGSQAAGAGLSLHFGEGRWNMVMMGGAADLNYKLYGFGGNGRGPVEINQQATIARVQLAYGITDTISVGIDATYLDTKLTTPGLSELLDPVLPDFGVRVTQVVYGPTLSFSTVDDTIYPTQGVGLDYTGSHGQGLTGFKRDFWKNVAIGTGYIPVRDNVVLAGKLTACNITDGAPFYNLCGIGITDGFRGYPAGEYLDNALGSVQGAARFRFGPRWGGAVFGGVGAVARELSELSAAETLYAGGVGVRFRLSKKFPLDFAVDGAINATGDQTVYVRVGQAF